MPTADETKPTTKPVRTLTVDGRKFALYATSYGLELWRLGRCPYLAGYVSDAEHMGTAIDNHQEEMRVMLAQARDEFWRS